MKDGVSVFVVISLLIHLGGGKDLYWRPNSNWGNPSNWASGRVPECGEKVSLQNVPDESVVYLDTDTTISSIALPENGQLLLGDSVTIRLTPDTECKVSGESPPMAATVNEFVGVTTDYWECPHNWMTNDGSPVEHAPCADDNAIFDKGYFSFVESNASIYVRSVTVRGSSVKSPTRLETREFKLKLEVNPKCGDDPSLCPCPDDSQCPKVFTEQVTAKPQSNVGVSRGGVVAGVLIPIIVILIAVLVVIAVLVTVYKYRMKISYVKEGFVEENLNESTGDEGKGVYDNPLFSDEVKVDLGAPAEDVPVDPGDSYELKDTNLPPSDGGEPKNDGEPFESGEEFDKNAKSKKNKKTKEPKMNQYERF